jgi:hypothetical protein
MLGQGQMWQARTERVRVLMLMLMLMLMWTGRRAHWSYLCETAVRKRL